MTDRGPPKPSAIEDDFFAREDVEKKRKLALHLAREMAADERRRLQDLHHMHCPSCGLKMETVRYRTLEVEVCFACGGIFLDKGEIDVIAAPHQKGIMAAILNWFRDETQNPVK
jgi:Zn-finger nucleic acid-binding protein